MKIREIPKDEWKDFFDTFSRQHERWLITSEIFGYQIGAQTQDRELTFQGITAEWDELSGPNTITVMMGGKPDEHITHAIHAPTHVSLEQADDGADAALAIKSSDGTIALLRFRSAMLPDWVDGVVPSVTHVAL